MKQEALFKAVRRLIENAGDYSDTPRDADVCVVAGDYHDLCAVVQDVQSVPLTSSSAAGDKIVCAAMALYGTKYATDFSAALVALLERCDAVAQPSQPAATRKADGGRMTRAALASEPPAEPPAVRAVVAEDAVQRAVSGGGGLVTDPAVMLLRRPDGLFELARPVVASITRAVLVALRSAPAAPGPFEPRSREDVRAYLQSVADADSDLDDPTDTMVNGVWDLLKDGDSRICLAVRAWERGQSFRRLKEAAPEGTAWTSLDVSVGWPSEPGRRMDCAACGHERFRIDTVACAECGASHSRNDEGFVVRAVPAAPEPVEVPRACVPYYVCETCSDEDNCHRLSELRLAPPAPGVLCCEGCWDERDATEYPDEWNTLPRLTTPTPEPVAGPREAKRAPFVRGEARRREMLGEFAPPLRDAVERVVLTAIPIIERQGDEDVVVGYRHKTGAMHALMGQLGLNTPMSNAVPLRSARDGLSLIAAERRRQVEAEGWTPEHDAEHDGDELAQAAAAYCLGPTSKGYARSCWPWDVSWWKPGPTRIRELEKAGALIAAEIDRLLAAERAAKEGASDAD